LNADKSARVSPRAKKHQSCGGCQPECERPYLPTVGRPRRIPKTYQPAAGVG
jgi:hypothetical protein